jgi:hypothetical protein
MQIDPLIEHTRALIPHVENRIAACFDFEAEMHKEPRLKLPAIYFEYLGEDAEAVFPEMQTYEQLSVERFNVYLELDNTADPRGQRAQNLVEGFKIALFAAILNYTYLEQQHPIEFSRGYPYYMDRGRYIFKFEFRLIRRYTYADGYAVALPNLDSIFADWNLTNADEQTYPNAQTPITDLND